MMFTRAFRLCKKINDQKFFYVKESRGICLVAIPNNSEVILVRRKLYVNIYDFRAFLYLKGYGKTWALTKEELE